MRIEVYLLSGLSIEVGNTLHINIEETYHIVHISLREEIREQKQDDIHSQIVLFENRSSLVEVLSVHK